MLSAPSSHLMLPQQRPAVLRQLRCVSGVHDGQKPRWWATIICVRVDRRRVSHRRAPALRDRERERARVQNRGSSVRGRGPLLASAPACLGSEESNTTGSRVHATAASALPLSSHHPSLRRAVPTAARVASPMLRPSNVDVSRWRTTTHSQRVATTRVRSSHPYLSCVAHGVPSPLASASSSLASSCPPRRPAHRPPQ